METRGENPKLTDAIWLLSFSQINVSQHDLSPGSRKLLPLPHSLAPPLSSLSIPPLLSPHTPFPLPHLPLPLSTSLSSSPTHPPPPLFHISSPLPSLSHAPSLLIFPHTSPPQLTPLSPPSPLFPTCLLFSLSHPLSPHDPSLLPSSPSLPILPLSLPHPPPLHPPFYP